jgi:hypothetical protein
MTIAWLLVRTVPVQLRYNQGLQMKDEDEENLHLDEELSLSSTFIQDERIN